MMLNDGGTLSELTLRKRGGGQGRNKYVFENYNAKF